MKDLVLNQTSPIFGKAKGVTASSNMASSDMNDILAAYAERTEYLRMLGIYPWDSAFNYPAAAFVQDDNIVYKSKAPNVNKKPNTNTELWDICPMTASEISRLMGKTSQIQAHTSFTTTGTPSAYIGSFAPLPESLVANLRAQVTFHASSNGAASTLNVNGFGAKPLKQYDAAGELINASIFANQMTDVVFDGADWVVLDSIHNPYEAGKINYFARNAAPAGYLKANGALVSRAVYASLFAAIGTTFGAGDGLTTFALPDLRGEFLRGWDDGRGVDSGRMFGSKQSGQNESHTHGVPAGVNGGFLFGGTAGIGNNGTAQGYPPTGAGFGAKHSMFGATDYAGGTETRPRNVALLACIKF